METVYSCIPFRLLSLLSLSLSLPVLDGRGINLNVGRCLFHSLGNSERIHERGKVRETEGEIEEERRRKKTKREGTREEERGEEGE